MKNNILNWMKYAAILLLTIVAIGWKLRSNKATNQAEARLATVTAKELPVKTKTVKRCTVSSFIEGTGTINSQNDLDLYVETQGRITNIYKKKGQRVTKGELIAKVDAEILIKQAEAAKANYESLLTDLLRMKKLVQEDAATKKQLQDVEVRLSKAKSDHDIVIRHLEDTKIKAPISGYINDDFIEEGMMISGQTKICNIISTENLIVKIELSESEMTLVSKGDQVDIFSGNYPLETFQGTITHVAQKASSNNQFSIEIAIADNELLKAGMYIHAKLKKEKQGAILIARSAIANSLHDASVFVVKNKQVTEQKVAVCQTVGDKVEICKGLSEGDIIVTSGTINLYPGARVKILE